MAQFSAGASSSPYEMPSQWRGGRTDYPGSLSPPSCSAGGGRRLLLSSTSAAVLEATGRQPTAAGATAFPAKNLQEHGESVVAHSFSGFAAASPLPLHLPSASRRYYLQPVAAATGGQASSAADGAAAAAPSASIMSPQIHHKQASRSGDEAPAFSSGALPYPLSVSEAESVSLAARGGADRRPQTQRPLHRAHPYGSSLLGRLVNKITSSLTSLSSFVPRASAVSRREQKNDDAAGAAAAAPGTSPGYHEGARPSEVLDSPLQESVYGSSVCGSSSGAAAGGANTSSLRRLPASGAAHVGPTTASAAAPAAVVPTNAASAATRVKDTQEGGDGTAADIGGDYLWSSEKQHSLPYHQLHPGATMFHGAAAGPTDSEEFLCEQGSYVSAGWHQKLQEQQQVRPQQLQQVQQQQQLRRQPLQAAGLGRSRCGRGFDNDAEERRTPVGVGGPYMSLSGDAVQKEAAAAGGAAGERRAAAAVSAVLPCSYYEVPRQCKLAESCFDSEAAGSAAPNASADACGALFLEPCSVLQQQQRPHTVLSEDRDFGPAWTAESQQAEGTLFSDDYGVPVAAATRGRLDSRGRLLSRSGNVAFLAQEQGRLEQQQELCGGLALPVNIGASSLPLRRDLLQECSVGQRQQYGVPVDGRKQLCGFQEQIGSGVSLSSRTSSNSVLFTAPDDVISQARRRPPRGCGDGSSSLFSHAVAPAWLSSATADLLDADAGAAAATGEAATVADAAREPSSRAARAAPRFTRGAGVATKKAAAGSRSSPLLNPRQEQLTVEQLQKLYLRCQPLRWRVRLRDLLRQEVVVAAAAAAEKKTGQVLGQSEPMVAASGAVGIASPADGSHDRAAAQGGALSEKEIRGPSVDSSSQTQQAKEGGSRLEDASGRGGSGAEETAVSMPHGRIAATQRAAAPTKEQDQQAAVAAQTGSSGESLFSKPSAPGSMVQQASSRGEERKEEQKQPQQVSKSSLGMTGEDSGAAAGFGVHERGREQDTTGGVAGTKDKSAMSLSGAAPPDIDAADGGKRTKLTSEATATEGGAAVTRSLFGSGATGAGGAGAPSSSVLFGSSNSSTLFGIRRTAPVAGPFEKEKLHVGGVAEQQGNGTKTSATEKPDFSLFGKSSVEAKAGGSSSVPAPLFGSSSSSLFEGVTAAAAQQPQESKESLSDKTGATTPSLLGGIAPASRLFGGARSSSTPQKQVAQPVVAEQASATSQPPAHKQAEKEQPPNKEAANTSSTDGQGIKDKPSPGKAAATTTAGGTGGGAADKPGEDTSALPWWQQNLNKPCTVMPEEDFAPEADDEEEAGEEKDKDAEKELPPLKVPNIFGSGSSSGGGLFGFSGANTSSLSLFKTTAETSFPSTKPSAASTASSTGAATGPPSLFGSSGTGAGLWNQNSSSSSSSLFGGVKLSAPGSSTSTPSGSLFGGHDASKPSSALSSAKADAAPGASSAGNGTSGEKGPTSLFGNLTASSSAFATQKTSASLFGGSIFGNPVAASQSVNSSQQTPGASAAPGAGAGGLFVFGASAGGTTPPPAATTAPPAGQSQPASGGTTAVPSFFGSALQQSQQNGSGTGKRGRDAADGGGAAAAPAAKSLFAAAPASTAAAAGAGLGLFGQRQPAGGSTLFGGGTPGSGGLFSTSGTVTSPPPGQAEKNAAGKTGFEGGGIFGYRDSSSSSSSTAGPIFGATRCVTPVFGSNNSSSKESVGSSSSTASAGAASAAPGASAATGSSLGIFGSSSSNNPFGFGGSTCTSGVSLFGGSTSTPADSARSATAESSFAAVQPLWSAGKGTTTMQGLFSGASNNNAGMSAAASRMDAGAAGGAASNGMHQPSRSLFGDSTGGNVRSATGQVDARNTTGVQGGSSAVPSSLFGNASGTSAFTFGAAPASAAAQQQQQPTGSASTSTAGAPTAGGAEAGNGANAFFGALPPGVRRPRLTIKRSKR